VIFLLALQLRLGLLSMHKAARRHKEKILMKSPNCVAIMGILAEIARRLNENMSKVEFKPLQALGTRSMIESAKAVGEVSQA
jgi:hypothetical protein